MQNRIILQCDKCQKCLAVSLWKETIENRIVIISVPNVQGWDAPKASESCCFLYSFHGIPMCSHAKAATIIGQATGKQLPERKVRETTKLYSVLFFFGLPHSLTTHSKYHLR